MFGRFLNRSLIWFKELRCSTESLKISSNKILIKVER
jgi:hypothetical protein